MAAPAPATASLTLVAAPADGVQAAVLLSITTRPGGQPAQV